MLTRRSTQELVKLGRRKTDAPALPTVKFAVLGDNSTQFLTMALKGAAIDRKVLLDLFEADYDQIDLQVFDPSSHLRSFEPEYVFLYQSSEKFARWHYDRAPAAQSSSATERLGQVERIIETLGTVASRKFIIVNYAEIDDSVFGAYASHVELSLVQQIRRLNLGLAEISRRHPNIFILDLAALQALRGREFMFDPKQFYTSKNALSVEATGEVAARAIDIVAATRGDFIKCVILDLDNTLWGGVIGDDGMEKIEIGDLGLGLAFSALQSWVKQLRRRGIILAVCSKNDDANARRPFQEHPEMILRMEDIAVFVANWDSKADNIRYIQSVLNISFSSMAFFDDNPVERHVVKSAFPEMVVPELPPDPTHYLSFLQGLNLFETVSFTEEDAERTQQYQAEAGRREAKASFTSDVDFMRSLEMTALVEGFGDFNLPRVAQLVQRSNQFNLRTRRYSDAELRAMAVEPKRCNLAFSLADKFGDYGMISVVMFELRDDGTAFIDTWIMSCRVLGRGMEKLVLNETAAAARAMGAHTLFGEYLPTSKNGMVKDHYSKLGFEADGGLWKLSLGAFRPFEVEIKPRVAETVAGT